MCPINFPFQGIFALRSKSDGEDAAFAINGAGANWTSIGKKRNRNLNHSLYVKINSKWIMDLNVQYKTSRKKNEKIFRTQV